MKRWLLVSTAAVVLSAGAAQADFTLHVLHINDFHSRIEPINKFDSTCDAEDAAKNECFGGVARLASKIREADGDLFPVDVLTFAFHDGLVANLSVDVNGELPVSLSMGSNTQSQGDFRCGWQRC